MSNTLKISRLKLGQSKILNLGHKEITFEMLGHTLTLRTILRNDLVSAQQACQDLFDYASESEVNHHALPNWIQALKIETLSYSIIKFDDLDFKGIKFIEFEDEDGSTSKIQKHVFVRDILKSWEDSSIDVLFKKFNEVTDLAEEESKVGVIFSDNDLQDRITELEDEIKILKAKVPVTVTEDGASRDSEISLDVEDLRRQVFTPKHDEFTYAEEAQETVTVEDESFIENPVDNSPKYVHEDGTPLTDSEIEMILEEERLFKLRQSKKEAAEALSNKRRQPLNQVEANIRNTEPIKKNPEEFPTVNANSQGFDPTTIPIATGFANMEPEVLRPKNSNEE